MFKILSVVFFVATSLQQHDCSILPRQQAISVLEYSNNKAELPILEISSKWVDHIKDFVDLVDIDEVLGVVFGYMMDPEVLNFVTFILSDDFKQVIWEFESITEFKEAFKYFSDRGYDVSTVIDYVNEALDLPPFEKPNKYILKSGKGMTGLIEDLISALPVEEAKKLFETKLETSPEVAELFETVNSPEFMDIMKRMSANPKFGEIKNIFKGYGFDFKYLCGLAKDILGEYYQGVFCDNI